VPAERAASAQSMNPRRSFLSPLTWLQEHILPGHALQPDEAAAPRGCACPKGCAW
jgi:hypothetical protein